MSEHTSTYMPACSMKWQSVSIVSRSWLTSRTFTEITWSLKCRLPWQVRSANRFQSNSQRLWYLHVTRFECSHEGRDNGWVKVRTRAGNNQVFGLKWRHRAPVGSITRQSVESVGDRQYSGLDGYLPAFAGTVSRAIESVMMRKDNRQDSAQSPPYRFKQSNAFLDVFTHLHGFFGSQTRCFVKNVAARFKLADVVEERRCSNVIDAFFVEVHSGGDIRGIKSNPVGVVVSVFVIRDELLKYCQDAEVRLAEFAEVVLFALVQSSHSVGCY